MVGQMEECDRDSNRGREKMGRHGGWREERAEGGRR